MFHTDQPRASTLNAIPHHPTDPNQAAHRAENLAACLELRDLGLQLARAAAARALAAHEQTPAPDTPSGAPLAPRQADPDLAFARHASSVRQSVELWEKITSNAFARRPHSWPGSSDFDPDLDPDDPLYAPQDPKPAYCEMDRSNLSEAVGTLAQTHPNHAEIRQTLDATIEETLTAHPDDHVSANFARVCQAFGIAPDRACLLPHLESQLRPPPGRWPKLE